MPFAEEITETAQAALPNRKWGAYYGSADGLAPGAGLIFPNVLYPIYNPLDRAFEARRGPILVLTHECDIDPANNRPFNKGFVLAPLILVPAFASTFKAEPEIGLRLARDVGADRVSRMLFLPPGPGIELGAFIYLNAIASGHVDQLGGAAALCALSQYAMSILDFRFENHFRRPKDQPLPRTL